MAELGRHEDARGIITDLIGAPLDGVTRIWSKAGAVRGNHVHIRTVQWAYVCEGTMTFAWTEDDGVHTRTEGPGALVCEPAGVPHAWRSDTDTTVLVFTRGPRSGEAYESDTARLDERYWLLR